MELKSHHLLLVAIAVLIVGIILGLLTGSMFPVLVERVISGTSTTVTDKEFNVSLSFFVWFSSACTALVLWFFSTVLFHLEKNRNFNRKTIELLEKIVEQQAAHTTVEVSEQSAKVAAAE